MKPICSFFLISTVSIKAAGCYVHFRSALLPYQYLMSDFLDLLQFGWVEWEGFDQRKSNVQSINRGLTLETTTLLDQKRLSSVKIKT